ncbi:MAG TPA: tetratricopeptide repeat protein, partial [Myxococcales bacterium]|nr:tetratricopeptide repeat protein [Myxococcales bacterium]
MTTAVRLLPFFASGWVLVSAVGAGAEETGLPHRLPVDREAMAEALAADRGPATPFANEPAIYHYLLGCLAAERGDHPEAVEQFRQTLAHDEGATHVSVRLASEYWRLGLGDRAEETLRNALAIEPHSAEAHQALGTLLLQSDRVEAAERELRRAVLLDPARGEAYRSLAQAELRLGDDAKLADCLDA